MTPRWTLMARRFYEQALVDLDSARENLRPRRFHNAVMFAEQAAEKALKAAYWHLLAEEPAWKHAMEPVAMKIADKSGGVPGEILSAITGIEAILEQSRYPSGDVNGLIPADQVSVVDATAAISGAETVMTWVKSLLELPSGKPRRHKS